MRYLSPLPILFTIALSAQQVSWLESWPVDYSLNPSMASQVLTAGPNGDLLSVRHVSGVFAFGVDLFGQVAVERLDPADGAVLATCMLFDSVSVDAGAVDAAGNMYVAGRYMGALGSCDGAMLGNTSPAMWNVDVFLMAFAPDGSILWSRDLSVDHPQTGRVESLALDPAGDLWYAIGQFDLGEVIKVDAEGHDAETRAIDGVTLLGTIDFDPWGGLYVTGASDENGFAFGGQSYQFTPGSGYQMFVLRYDPSGNAGFAQFASDVTFQRPTVLDDGHGRAYLAGELLDTTSWDGIHLNGPDWVYSTFLTQLDSSGHFLWARESDPPGGTIEGDMQRAKGPCIAVDGDANVYFMGDTRGTVNWPGGVQSGNGVAPQGGITIIKFGADGTALWAANSAAGGGSDFARTLTTDASGAVYFAVHTAGEFTMSPLNVNTDGGQDAAVGKLNGTSTGVANLTAGTGLSVWPSPAGALLNVHSSSAMFADLITATGQYLRGVRLVQGRNTLDLSDLASGLYFLRANSGGGVKVVKE